MISTGRRPHRDAAIMQHANKVIGELLDTIQTTDLTRKRREPNCGRNSAGRLKACSSQDSSSRLHFLSRVGLSFPPSITGGGPSCFFNDYVRVLLDDVCSTPCTTTVQSLREPLQCPTRIVACMMRE